jgi:hypothetical protein
MMQLTIISQKTQKIREKKRKKEDLINRRAKDFFNHLIVAERPYHNLLQHLYRSGGPGKKVSLQQVETLSPFTLEDTKQIIDLWLSKMSSYYTGSCPFFYSEKNP